jgi:hypothetical protein
MAEMHHPHGGGRVDNPVVDHEESDVNIRAIFGFIGGLLVSAIVIHLAVWVLFRYFDAREGRHLAPAFPLAATQESRVPPEPRLQTNPRQDLSDLRAREDQVLTSYGWVDKNTGVVRIPIDEAMKLTLQRGLPTRERSAR